MRNSLVIVLALIFLSSSANAQLWQARRIEVTGGAGTSQMYGDIGGYTPGKNILGLRDFTFLQTRFSINANVRYRFLEDVSVRGNFTFGTLFATDARGSHASRGYQSSTTFFEPSVLLEYYFIKAKEENNFLFLKGKDKEKRSFFSLCDFYVFAGIGGVAYNVTPNATLAPVATPLNGFAPVIPAGIGINYNYSGNVKLGLEFGVRYPFTDNLDGYTDRFSQYNDIYQILNLTFTYKLKTGWF
jgi:hypothetical protein